MKTSCSYLLMIWLILSLKVSSAQTPTITAAGVYTCTGTGTSKLTLPSGYVVYEWYNASNVLVASTQTYLATPGTYTAKVKQTALGSYTSVSAFTVTQIVPTAPTVTPPSDVVTAVCGTSTRNIVASGATNYDWKRDGTALSITTATLSVAGTSVTTAGTYSYTVSTTNSTTSCTSTSTAVSLKVSPKPTTPVISALSPNLICGTDTKTLTATTGGTSYVWKRDATVLGSTTNTLSVTGNDVSLAGTYTYKVALQNSVGCASDTSVAVSLKVSPKPTTPVISALSPNLICGTDTKTLTATSGGTSYVWKRDGTTLGSTINTLAVSGNDVSTAGTYNYKVVYQNSVGCASDTSVAVSLKVSPKPATPVISPVSSSLICGTESKTLTATSGGSSYTWKRDATVLGSTTNSLAISGASLVTAGVYKYKVVLINAVGCASDTSAVINLTYSPKPVTPIISPVNPNLICGINTTTLTATSGGASYIWKRDTTTLSAVINTLSVKGTDVLVAGTYNYKVVLKNTVGCFSDTSVAISLKVSPKPATPVISSVSPNLVCGTEVKTLTATSGGTSYVWKRDTTTLASTINTLSVKGTDVLTAGTYSYKVVLKNAVGCVSDTSVILSLKVSPKPVKPVIAPVDTNAICGISTKTLTATTGGTSYIWKRDTTTLSSKINALIVTGNDVLKAGTYLYRVILQNSVGCLSDTSVAASLKVSPKPATPVITTPSSTLICGSETKTLTATSGGSSYIWKRGATILSSKVNTLTVARTDVSTDGTFNFTVTLKNVVGCVSDTSAVQALVLSVNPAKPTITAGGVTTFCEGGSVVLTSSYTSNGNVWSRINGTDIQTSGVNGITVTASDTYTVKAKNIYSCFSVSSEPQIVTVNANPSPPVILEGTAVSICNLDSTVLNANNKGNGIYSWNNGKKTKSITVNTAGNYSLTYTDGNTCTSAASLITVLTVNPLPAKPTITASRPLEFCDEDFTTLKSSVSSGYIWSNGQTSAQIDVKVSSIVSVVAVSDKGCKSKDASNPLTVVVNPLPNTPTVLANGPLIFCPDSTVTLSSSVIGSEYIWTNTLNSTVFNKTQSVVIAEPGEYAVQAISAKKCVSKISKSVKINVREAPQPASILASPIATFCKGGNVTLRALIANGNVDRYSWRNEDNQKEIATTSAITTDTSGRYSVKVRDTFGCFSAYSKVLKVTVNPLPNKPTLTIVRPKIFCDGDSTLLQASLPSTTTNGSKNIYQWTVDGQLQSNINGRTFIWKKANSIGVTVIDTNGCKSVASSDTIKTTVNPLPSAPSITIKGSNPFCADKNVVLTAIGVQANSYKWSISSSTSSTITVNTAGNVTVQAVSAFACLSNPSQPIILNIYPLPAAPQIANVSSTVFCDGESVTLSTVNSNKAYWFKSTNDSLGTGSNNAIAINKSGNYFARVEDRNSCFSAPSNSITVDVRALPTMPVISQAGAFYLEAQSSGDEEGYIWKYNNEVQKSFITKTIKVKKDGDYQVQASVVYNQVALPGGKLMCYSKPSNVYKYTQDLSFEGVNVYPNPSASGDITIQVVEDLVGAELIVYTMEGKIIEEFKIGKFDTPKTIKLTGSIGNVYYIKLRTDSFEKVKKVLVMN
ncbi:T9SS type A sorting domain-containing protein [Arcicella lustrica]|uniref:T9SS type A sorting domain-containing protein n=1 Tax=Arcicella lustrica TaxID=2984196 RepID=A0ABU5SFB0_9BACT|nr:T9SS type A sorting domain-containing protein [Arcicella sp. DC25W]MEA5425967.1 T9SS type A sorting domain-containing protein [Arcicella sp. DC25W]